MILLIDNYDSFSYNLYQLIGSVEPDILVIRNDAATVEEVAAMGAEAIVLSPGPGRPSEAGICEDVVRQLSGTVPILGVCLGQTPPVLLILLGCKPLLRNQWNLVSPAHKQ